MENIVNTMGPYDPFKDLGDITYDPFKESGSIDSAGTLEKITIHVVQRKTNKYITTVEGLKPHEINPEEFLKNVRKKCSCNGSVDKETGNVQLQGNQKTHLVKILMDEFGISKNTIVLRGL